MVIPKAVGFLRMQKEAGERRVFLPDFVQYITSLGALVYLEEGYGSRCGFDIDDYRQGNLSIREASREKVFQQDLVLVLRAPLDEEYELLGPESCLVSMLHFPTRPNRVNLLNQLGCKAISLDSIVDDNNLRMVENMKAVAWNGLEAAFNHLETIWPELERPDGEPIRVLILGSGMVGKHAVSAATKLGNVERNNVHIEIGGKGSLALVAGRNITSNVNLMAELLPKTDVLVDATQRRDTSVPVIPNEWLGWLPEHAVVVDLAVDPYTLHAEPPVVRGVEGIPQGNLDKYVFLKDDPDWDRLVPKEIPSKNRRTTVSCYSWPGIHPEACMGHYGRQLRPLMNVLFNRDYDDISYEKDFFERALYRAKLSTFNDIQEG